MQVNFLKPVTICSKTYGVGIYHVPNEDAENNWFFDALIADGSAVVLKIEEPDVEPEAEPTIKTKRNK